MANFLTLRAANEARNTEWALPGSTELILTLSLTYRANELAGELGEAAAELLNGGTEGPNVESLAAELADVVICADLTAMSMDMPLPIDYDMVTDEMDGQGILGLVVAVGRTCNLVKKLERESLGFKGSRVTTMEVAEALKDVVMWAYVVADDHDIELDVAIVAKFNATSEKVGLTTRIMSDAVLSGL